MTHELPAQCGATYQHLVCDREAGHTGPHRGYDAQIDEALFWLDKHRTYRFRPDPQRPGGFVMEDDG